MNIKVMRSVHLYLGVFFAPLLVFFLISGCWQAFNLHRSDRPYDGYKAPAILRSLSSVHKDQKWSDGKPSGPSMLFRYLIVLMSLGLLVTTSLGIFMAFQYAHPWIVWSCLFMGSAVPCSLIWINHG